MFNFATQNAWIVRWMCFFGSCKWDPFDLLFFVFNRNDYLRLQVGVYGYAAYSASKFALRGLAECLQQELVDRNIRLSLVYPPDTMTPGYMEGASSSPVSYFLHVQIDNVSLAVNNYAGDRKWVYLLIFFSLQKTKFLVQARICDRKNLWLVFLWNFLSYSGVASHFNGHSIIKTSDDISFKYYLSQLGWIERDTNIWISMVTDWLLESGNFRSEDHARDNKDIITGNNANGSRFRCSFRINRFEGWPLPHWLQLRRSCFESCMCRNVSTAFVFESLDRDFVHGNTSCCCTLRPEELVWYHSSSKTEGMSTQEVSLTPCADRSMGELLLRVTLRGVIWHSFSVIYHGKRIIRFNGSPRSKHFSLFQAVLILVTSEWYNL